MISDTDLTTCYRVMQELETTCSVSSHNSIVVIKNILANELMKRTLNKLQQ